MTDLDEQASSLLGALAPHNRNVLTRYPSPRADRQPVHTVYGGAHLYKSTTPKRLGELAIRSLSSYGDDPWEFAQAVGFVPANATRPAGDLLERLDRDAEALRRDSAPGWLAAAVYQRMRAKLEREPVEDFRIDFEDGFGARPDAEEDEVAAAAAQEVAAAMRAQIVPPFIGIRIKSLGDEWAKRATRTLGLFVDELLTATSQQLPDNFVVTLPKVTHPEQVAALVKLFELLERKHGLPPKALKLELMIELTQTLMGPDGRSPMPAMLDACDGRCFAAHLGTYDFTASCDITAAHQVMRHPMCDLAKGMMLLAFGGTGVFLSDGATNVMPVPAHRGESLTADQQLENRQVVHNAWRTMHDNVRHSLVGGFYQGWDLHPAQLPVRYATTYAFFLEGFAQAAARLSNFVDKAAQATLVGDVFDDAATGQGLLNYFVRALNCGAIEEADLAQTGLTREEYQLRSFAKILAARRERLTAAQPS